MRKIVITVIVLSFFQTAMAQSEGRVGFFTGLFNSSLLNANDQDWGDYLPTIKGMAGIEGSYYTTLGKKVSIGMTAQIGYWGNGQNYRGLYLDSSYYEAYTKMRYLRTGVAFNMGTNLLRRVSARVFGGANIGFLDTYTDRYEGFPNNGSRYILEITDNAVYNYGYDNQHRYGSINEKLYTPIDMNVFYGVAVDVKINDNLIFNVSGRFDNGLGQVENENKKKITFSGTDAQVMDYPAYTSAIKYHGPTRPEILRQPTTNQMYGVYLGLCYRFYDRDKHQLYFVN